MQSMLRFRHFGSSLAIWTVSIATALCVLAISVFLQWLIYDDWMHRTGPIQIVGSLLAAALVCYLVLRWQKTIRRHKEEMLRRFETIKWMNDRIRNSLQTIDLLAFVNPQATEQVRGAVDAIESVLQDVLEESHPGRTASGTRSETPARLDVEAKP
jgi:thiol:disulfide interchange protein